jgi:dihydrofolate reductase
VCPSASSRLRDRNLDATDIETATEIFSTRTTGAVVVGRRTIDLGEQPWGEDGTFHLPCFVLTHRTAPTLFKGKTSFTFVTEGPERAQALAQTAACDKAVNVWAPTRSNSFSGADSSTKST